MKQKLSQKISLIILAISLVLPFQLALAQATPNSQDTPPNTIDPSFDPGLLISNAAFTDTGTFGSADAIQKFLELKGSVLANTSPDFLAKLKEPDPATKTALEDPEANLPYARTAAELIYDSAEHFGLNPQVIIVMLQKEQSLITGSFDSDDDLQSALDSAVGFACPDSQPCGQIFQSFYRQLFGSFDAEGNRWLGAAASLMRSYNTPGGRGPMVDAQNETFGTPTIRASAVGDTIVIDNTQGGYLGVQPDQQVTLGNLATAALYRYTPHVFNGNYNFWYFYNQWFKYPNGTVIEQIGQTNTYVIDNGTIRQFSNFVATQRKINIANIVMVSPIEFANYTLEPPLPPIDGTLIKGDADPTVYLVENEVKQPISGPIFTQRKFSFKSVVTLPQAEVDSYGVGAYVVPLNGSLIIGSMDPTVYEVVNSVKQPISGAVFTARKLSFAKVLQLSDPEIASLPTGPYLTPPDMTQIKLADDPTIWWYKNDLKQQVSAFVYTERGVNTFPLVILSAAEMQGIPSGSPLPPRDGTVVQGDASTAIYVFQNGLKDLLTPAAYKRLRYPKPVILPQAEVDLYTSGSIITD